MKNVIFYLLLSASTFAISFNSFAEDPPEAETYLSDIADLGYINPNRPDRRYYEISGSPDIPVTNNKTPLPGNEFALKNDHSSSSFQTDGRNLLVPADIFKKITVAAEDIFLGKPVTAILDLQKAFRKNVLDGYTAISEIVDDYFGNDLPYDAGDTLSPADVGPVIGTCPATVTVTQCWTGVSYCSLLAGSGQPPVTSGTPSQIKCDLSLNP